MARKRPVVRETPLESVRWAPSRERYLGHCLFGTSVKLQILRMKTSRICWEGSVW